jgi:hypothetical protein
MIVSRPISTCGSIMCIRVEISDAVIMWAVRRAIQNLAGHLELDPVIDARISSKSAI